MPEFLNTRGTELLSNRERLILKAIVENYSKKSKPISSKLLTNTIYLKFSSATIRYDMAQLEQKGYLLKNHQSSGSIPSLKGYVFYLNNLITRKRDNYPIISLFEKIIQEKSFSKEKIIQKVLKLLCDLTSYATMNIVPDILKISKIVKIDLFLVHPTQVIILVITDKGEIQYKNIFLKKELDFTLDDLKKIVNIFSDLLVDKYLYEALQIIQSKEIEEKIPIHIIYYKKIIQCLNESFYDFMKNNSYVYGLNTFLNNSIFEDIQTIKEIMKIFNFNKKELNKIFFDSEKVIYKLVNQINLIPYNKFIIISAPYSINKNEKGFIALLGPIIMQYQEIIPILEYLSVYLSQID